MIENLTTSKLASQPYNNHANELLREIDESLFKNEKKMKISLFVLEQGMWHFSMPLSL